MSPELSRVNKTNKNWLLWQRRARNQKINIHLQPQFYQPANSVKIDPVDVETIGLTEIITK